jgi:hypothetical protein
MKSAATGDGSDHFVGHDQDHADWANFLARIVLALPAPEVGIVDDFAAAKPLRHRPRHDARRNLSPDVRGDLRKIVRHFARPIGAAVIRALSRSCSRGSSARCSTPRAAVLDQPEGTGMLADDYAKLDAMVDHGDASRLQIDIRLRSNAAAREAQADHADAIRRAIREGFREALADVRTARLIGAAAPVPSAARRWLRRAMTFALCAAIGSLTTTILSRPVSHTVVSALAPRSADPGLAYSSPLPPVAPSPGSQSAANPLPSVAQPPTGPGTFGLHEQ